MEQKFASTKGGHFDVKKKDFDLKIGSKSTQRIFLGKMAKFARFQIFKTFQIANVLS
jgi:hypothetical protein